MKRSLVHGFFLVLCALVLAPATALAHVGVGETSGFASGFLHPILGMDHVLAMFAVGLWAAQMGGRMTWIVPCAFVAVMIFGGVLGMAGGQFPFVEQGILASVLVFGVLIAGAIRLPVVFGVAVVGLFALFHGHAHGTEMPLVVDSVAYSAGFALASVLLHAVGIAVGSGLTRLAHARFARVAGGAIAAMGLYLVLGA